MIHMGKPRTARKNAQKRRARRVFAAIASELRQHEADKWTREAIELEQMRNEEERQHVHETWVRAVARSNEAFEKQQRIAAERKQLLAAIRKEMEEEENREQIDDDNAQSKGHAGPKPSPAPTPMPSSDLTGALLAKEAEASAYAAMRNAHNRTRKLSAVARLPCPFYSRTGCCPFPDEQCSGTHIPPSRSCFLLLQNMAMQSTTDKSSARISSEQEIRYEVEKFGEVLRIEIVQNEAPHLRGNVYIEFRTAKSAHSAWAGLRLRWFAGRRIHAHLALMSSWELAVCADALQMRCARGVKACNYLHLTKHLVTAANPTQPAQDFDAIIKYFDPHASERPNASDIVRKKPTVTFPKRNRAHVADQEGKRKRNRSRSRSRSDDGRTSRKDRDRYSHVSNTKSHR